EPTSRRFELLSARKFGPPAQLNRLGLGDHEAETRIFYNASGGSNSLFPQRYSGQQYAENDVETITSSTIDSYFRRQSIQNVDFIKLDIEGYEPAAIRGAEQMLRAGKIGIIQFEYSAVFLDAGSSLMQLMRYVADINPQYEFHKIVPNGTRRIPAYEHTLDN